MISKQIYSFTGNIHSQDQMVVSEGIYSQISYFDAFLEFYNVNLNKEILILWFWVFHFQ